MTYRPIAAALALLCLPLLACAGWTPHTGAGGHDESPDGRTITSEEIARWGVRNAWEAVERSAHVSMGETRSGQPGRLTMRGRSSILLDDSPVVVVDGIVRVHFRVLNEIHANRIRRIEILSGAEATTRYGTGSAGGAIVVTTMER